MRSIANRNELLKIFPKNGICAEVGVLAGDYSKVIKEILQPKELYLIDHFSGMVKSGDHNGQNIKDYDLDQEYINLQNHFKNDASVILKKGFSYDVLPEFPDDYLDVVYIDSDHTYAGTVRELEICFRKVKDGGYITGHDYDADHFPGCKKAVDDFCLKYNQPITWLTIEDVMSSYAIRLNKKDDLVTEVLESGFSMLSRERLENLKNQIDAIIDEKIPGSFVETGVAQGGSIIFMKKYLDRLGHSRTIHACDSFQGLPPAGDYDYDYKNEHASFQDHSVVTVSKVQFTSNLEKMGVDAATIVTHEGWFSQTLAEITEPIALLRMDGDWYDSTMTTLDYLYDQVVPGGVVIIDDYGWWQGCKKAVHDFFLKRNIPLPYFHSSDGTEVWFIKNADTVASFKKIDPEEILLFENKNLKETIHRMEQSVFWKMRTKYLQAKWALGHPRAFLKKYFFKNFPSYQQVSWAVRHPKNFVYKYFLKKKVSRE